MVNKNGLPGIRFITEPQVLDEILPRMDIAAFVGFTSSGPLHIPVPLEDMDRFRDIFGGELELAWDAKAGRMQYAHLAPAVEAFFRNGGRRCWVVRVADTNPITNSTNAITNSFPLPGMVCADGNTLLPALACARSEGGWSDPLRVGTTLRTQALPSTGFCFKDDKYILDIPVQNQINKGDLLQVRFGDTLLFLAVESLEKIFADDEKTKPVMQVIGKKGFWFMTSHEPISQDEADVILLTPYGETSLPRSIVYLPDGKNPQVEMPLKNAPAPGSLLRLEFDDSSTLLLQVMETEEISSAGSPLIETVLVKSKDGLWPVKDSYGLEMADNWLNQSLPGLISVSRLSFDLWVWRNDEVISHISELAFCDLHPRFWANLPPDCDLFQRPDGKSIYFSSLEDEASDPRFPLAGPDKKNSIYLPLGMTFMPDITTSRGPLGNTDNDKLPERNGLSKFSADLFIDPDLANIGTGSLLNEAEHKYYLTGDIMGIPLRGLHSLLPIDEVTIVAVPDAVHRGWRKTPPESLKLLNAPVLHPVLESNGKNSNTLSWSPVIDAETYIIQEGSDPAFEKTLREIEYKHEQLDKITAVLNSGKGCPILLYYRVRAVRGSEIGPWSNTQKRIIPSVDFKECSASSLMPPELEEVLKKEDMHCFQWTLVEGAKSYTLQESSDPAFITRRDIYADIYNSFDIRARNMGIYYYRVRANFDEKNSPWSNTQVLAMESMPGWTYNDIDNYNVNPLLEIQGALLRFCAARGDMMAVLSLPDHYRDEEVLSHVSTLESRIQEDRDRSFGAIYYPWIFLHQETPSFPRFTPPDGAVCGNIAAMAIALGAWFAPANVSVKDAISLYPIIDEQRSLKFFESRINLIRQSPQGFLISSASTLSNDAALAPINVRRLLILVRRLALREGTAYVFQPNNENFHRLVRHKFERLLSNLYVRGAFAGDSPEMAYNVVTDRSVNTKESLDLGRFIVELRVSPSRPMVFITVKLIQTGHEILSIQET